MSSFSYVVLAVGLVVGVTPLAAQDDCKPVFDALDKVMSTPTHIYSTTKSAGKPQTNEIIYAADGIYNLEKGKWSRSSVKTEQVIKQEKENRQKTGYVCKALPDETVDGEMAKVYNTKTSAPDQKTDGKISISKNGLPLRNEIDIDAGPKGGKTHYSVRYEYKGVEAPKL